MPWAEFSSVELVTEIAKELAQHANEGLQFHEVQATLSGLYLGDEGLGFIDEQGHQRNTLSGLDRPGPGPSRDLIVYPRFSK